MQANETRYMILAQDELTEFSPSPQPPKEHDMPNTALERTRLLKAAVAAATLVFSAFAYAGKDTLVIGTTQFPATLNPNIQLMLAKYHVLNMATRPFTVYDQNWELVCLLCTELPTIENGLAVEEEYGEGKKGIAVTYTIHPDAQWGDGVPVTTADVEFTVEVGKHPDSGVANAEDYRRIRTVETHDDKTFTLHVDRITYDYNALGMYLLPAHVERQHFTQPSDYQNRTAYDTDSYNPGLYFGPYRVAKIESGAYIELVKNDTWWGDSPAFEKVIVRIVGNTAALEANLLSGSIDLIDGVLGLTLDQALSFRDRHSEDFNFIFKPGLIYEHIDMNLDNPILADLRVRAAMLHAIDRTAISEQLFAGEQPVAHNFVHFLDASYHDGIKRYEYDVELASQLLDQAGWTEMHEGIRHNAEGRPLMLEFGTTAGSRVRENVQQVLQSQWREVGIDIRIRNEPPRVYFGETVRKRQFDGLAMYAWVATPESSPRDQLHSEQIPTEDNNYSGSNIPGFRNAAMDALIDAVEVELIKDKRKLIWADIQNLYVEHLPALPLYFRANPYIIPKWLEGIEPTGTSATTTLWIENWKIVE